MASLTDMPAGILRQICEKLCFDDCCALATTCRCIGAALEAGDCRPWTVSSVMVDEGDIIAWSPDRSMFLEVVPWGTDGGACVGGPAMLKDAGGRDLALLYNPGEYDGFLVDRTMSLWTPERLILYDNVGLLVYEGAFDPEGRHWYWKPDADEGEQVEYSGPVWENVFHHDFSVGAVLPTGVDSYLLISLYTNDEHTRYQAHRLVKRGGPDGTSVWELEETEPVRMDIDVCPDIHHPSLPLRAGLSVSGDDIVLRLTMGERSVSRRVAAAHDRLRWLCCVEGEAGRLCALQWDWHQLGVTFENGLQHVRVLF